MLTFTTEHDSKYWSDWVASNKKEIDEIYKFVMKKPVILGGGAGGSIGNGQPGAAGGSGVVIIAVPNAVYPTVSAPGATISTPGSAPGRTVLTYSAASPTSPGNYTFTS